MIIKLPELPPPLSACFINLQRGGRVKSKRYRAWEKLCCSPLTLIRGDFSKIPITKPVSVDICLKRPDKRRRDLDNMAKPLCDLIGKKHLNVINDDSQIHDLRMRWGGNAPVTIRIERMT